MTEGQCESISLQVCKIICSGSGNNLNLEGAGSSQDGTSLFSRPPCSFLSRRPEKKGDGGDDTRRLQTLGMFHRHTLTPPTISHLFTPLLSVTTFSPVQSEHYTNVRPTLPETPHHLQ